MVAAPHAESVGNGDLGSDREDGDPLTDAYAAHAHPHAIVSFGTALGSRRGRAQRPCAGGPPALATLAALVAIVGTVASVGVAGAPPASAPTGRRCTAATSRTRASSMASASTTASPPRTSPRPARRSTSRCRPPRRGQLDTLDRCRRVLPHVGRGPSRATPGPRASCATTPTTTSSCTTRRPRHPDRRPVHRRGHIDPPRRAPTRTTSRQPIVCQNGTGYSDPTVDSTQDLGGSIDPDIFTDSSTGASG